MKSDKMTGHEGGGTQATPNSNGIGSVNGSGNGVSKYRRFGFGLGKAKNLIRQDDERTRNKVLMADTDDSGQLNGTNMGILNGVQPTTGNVQVHGSSKAAAFSRMNSSSQSAHQTVNASSRRVVSSISSSSHHQHQSNETQTSMKQSSTHNAKSKLSEMQTTISQMKALSQQTTTSSSSSSSSSSALTTSSSQLKGGKSSVISLSPLNLIEANRSGENGDAPLDTGTVLVQEMPTFPTSPELTQLSMDMPNSTGLSSPVLGMNNHHSNTSLALVQQQQQLALAQQSLVNNNNNNNSITAGPEFGVGVVDSNNKDGPQCIRIEQKKVASSSSSKFRSGNYSTEQASANAAEMKKVSAGDIHYEEKASAHAHRQKVEVDGITAEKSAALKQEQRSLTQGGVTEEETRRAAAASMKLSTDTFTAEKHALAAEQSKQTRLGQGTVINSEHHNLTASQSKLTFHNQLSFPPKFEYLCKFDDLDSLGWNSAPQEVNNVIDKYSNELTSIVEKLRVLEDDNGKSVDHLNYASGVMKAAWNVPGHGHQVGGNLCDTFREMGGLDMLIGNISSHQIDLRVASARLLEQSLTADNCNYVLQKGFDCLDKVVKVAFELCDVEESQVGIGLFRHLFRHNEETCSDILRLNGLERLIIECRRMDTETLRNCAGAFVNLALFGGAENQEAMIKKKVHIWLFPLAFNNDDSIKYYACLAIAILVANKEIEAQIISKSNTLQLVEPFLTTHNPEEFAISNSYHGQGQSVQWLRKLVPVLSSQREEARSVAAFHFCMEAAIKKKQDQTSIFKQIGVIEPLKAVASSPNALGSKFAAQALRLIGENVPHMLSQQVPLWTEQDVKEWVIQRGFDKYANNFLASRVDGDLLFQLTEDMLKDDLKLDNGILRKRFMRDLRHLKKIADYSSCDSSNLNELLNSIHPEFRAYTYTLLNHHLDKETLTKCVTDEFLSECGVASCIHRLKISRALKGIESDNPDKPLDVFISYRRSNGSQLASLLKVHLTVKGFTVFIDVERLEAGKFDNNLLQSIRQARHFLLVLTPNALDRCVNDIECKDWVHKEIVAALESQCNIIPIMDSNFSWPESENLPEDMQPVVTFNGVKWIHDYQDACVEKIERFLKGESIPREALSNSRESSSSSPPTHGNSVVSTTPRPSQSFQRTLSGSDGRTE